jgi:hypothetical protein
MACSSVSTDPDTRGAVWQLKDALVKLLRLGVNRRNAKWTAFAGDFRIIGGQRSD